MNTRELKVLAKNLQGCRYIPTTEGEYALVEKLQEVLAARVDGEDREFSLSLDWDEKIRLSPDSGEVGVISEWSISSDDPEYMLRGLPSWDGSDSVYARLTENFGGLGSTVFFGGLYWFADMYEQQLSKKKRRLESVS